MNAMPQRKPISICIPVLKRYDLLRELLLSLHKSTVMPEAVYIINNGLDREKLDAVLDASPVSIFVDTPEQNLGVAASWNRFIMETEDDRVIVNDDVTFAPESLALLTACPADLVWASGLGFACFVLRDSCVEKVGMFDETISPGYGYYEDEDFLQRLDGRGTKPAVATAENVECGAAHFHSATLKASSHDEIIDHHRKFLIARGNYIKKWNLEGSFR